MRQRRRLARWAALALALWRVALTFLCVVVLTVRALAALLIRPPGLLAGRSARRSWSRWQSQRRRFPLVRHLERRR